MEILKSLITITSIVPKKLQNDEATLFRTRQNKTLFLFRLCLHLNRELKLLP